MMPLPPGTLPADDPTTIPNPSPVEVAAAARLIYERSKAGRPAARGALRAAIDAHAQWKATIEAAATDCVQEAKALRERFEADVLAESVKFKESIQKLDAAGVVGNAGDAALAAEFESVRNQPNVPAKISLNQ